MMKKQPQAKTVSRGGVVDRDQIYRNVGQGGRSRGGTRECSNTMRR